MKTRVPFNNPFIAGRELFYIARAVTMGNIGGDGHFTSLCSELLEERFGINRVLMTPSCTAALEMAAMLCEFEPGDEAIMPSYTFVSTANAFVRAGARPVFVDIRPDTLNIDESLIEDAITERTKAIVPVHYAGVGCDMDRIMRIADKHGLIVVEDAAQGVNAFYNRRALGSIGHLGCYSFHETKNYICGEGGALCINDERFLGKAEIIRDKGTNRQQFFRGQVDKYTWVAVGSSYVPSEIACAFLYGQLEMLDEISSKRRDIFEDYRRHFMQLEADGLVRIPEAPYGCQTNYHMFYLLVDSQSDRDALLDSLHANGVDAVFHYVPLHSSPMGSQLGRCSGALPITDDLSGRLLRLPMFYDMTPEVLLKVYQCVESFFGSRSRKTDATLNNGSDNAGRRSAIQ